MSRSPSTRCRMLVFALAGASALIPYGVAADESRQAERPPSKSKLNRNWEVHLVHGSHHDLGYTDLPSNVLREHDAHLDKVIEFCEQTADWPEDSRFRYVVEQAWSVQHYLRSCSDDKRKQLIQRMQEGRIEVTATLGNQITGLCSHEELIRLLYPSFRLKRQYGVPIHTAELNDIPGFSWGLASVLHGAGVRYFAPGVQDYFAWGIKVRPNWDEENVIARNMPGAFWWEGPEGSRVLLWYGGPSIEGPHLWTYEQAVRDLTKHLARLEDRGYPYNIVRLKFLGGRRDNSPPALRLSEIVRQWNERQASPRLIVSTNTRFFRELEKRYGEKLKVVRGELPDTDYPVGAISTARETGVNRLTHHQLASAEKSAACAAMVSDYVYPADTLAESYECVLMHDEHSWGMAHPVGPAQEAAVRQKGELAYRGAALAHDVLVKSTNRIADQIALEENGYHVVVFNPLARRRTDVVRMPAYPPAPCSSPMYWRQDRSGLVLAPSTVLGRRTVQLPADLLQNPFDLIDLSTGQGVPCQIITLTDPLAARPFASARYALGHISQTSQGALNRGKSQLMDLVFVAEDVPPLGLKTYRIVPRERPPKHETSLRIGDRTLESRFYRIAIDPQTGAVDEIIDKETGRQWVDREAAYGVNQVIVRKPKSGDVFPHAESQIQPAESGPVMATLVVKGNGPGCPQRTQEITLYDSVKRIDFATRLLKDATPHQEVYVAFPFKLDNARFRFEASNSVIEPIRDQWPGSNTSTYAVQDWVSARDDRGGVVYCSREAPLIKLGRLWPPAVSQAHHGVTSPDYGEDFLRDPARFGRGHIYSYVMAVNFRTNFQPVQVADALFRHSLTTHSRNGSPSECGEFGRAVANPLAAVAIQGPQDGPLPASGSFCQLDQPNVVLRTVKAAEDGDGIIVRLAETAGRACTVAVNLPNFRILRAHRTNLVEEDEAEIPHEEHTVRLNMAAHSIATVRLRGDPQSALVRWPYRCRRFDYRFASDYAEAAVAGVLNVCGRSDLTERTSAWHDNLRSDLLGCGPSRWVCWRR